MTTMYRDSRHIPPNTTPSMGHLPPNRVTKCYSSKRLAKRFYNRAVLTFIANSQSLQHLVDYNMEELLTYEIYDKLNRDEERLNRMNKVRRNIRYFRFSHFAVDTPKTDLERVLFVFRSFDNIMAALVTSDILFQGDHLLYYDISTNTALTKEFVDDKQLRPCMTDREIKAFEPVFGVQNKETKLSKRLYNRLNPGGVYGPRDYYKNDFLFPLGNCYKVKRKLSNMIYTSQEIHDLTFPVNCRQYVQDMIALYTAELFVAHMAVTESERPGTRPLTRFVSGSIHSPVVHYSEMKLFARTLLYLMQFEAVGREDDVDEYNSEKYDADEYNSDEYNSDKYNSDESLMTDYKNLIHNIYSTDYSPGNVYDEYDGRNTDEARYRGCYLTGNERLLVEFLECFLTNTSMFIPFKTNHGKKSSFHILDRWKHALGKAEVDRDSQNSGKCCDCFQNVFSTRTHLCMGHKEIYYIKYFDFSNCTKNFAPGYIIMEMDMHRMKVRPSKFLMWQIDMNYDTRKLTQLDVHLYLDYIVEVEFCYTYVYAAIGKGKSVPKFKTVVLLQS